jgi:hypothetical protein
MAGKATVVHRRDMQKAMIDLCCRPRDIEMRAQMVALRSFGVEGLDHVLLSRDTVPFINAMCVEKGIVGDPVIFQTQGEQKARKPSIVGTGATEHEKALRWIIGEFTVEFCVIESLADILPFFLFCREHGLLERNDGFEFSRQVQ